MRTRPQCALLISSAFVLVAFAARAADIGGTVRAVSGGAATVAVDGEMMPNAGDQAEIFFKLPGSVEEISVATGKVRKVEADSVEVQIDSATGEIAKDQLVRIRSEEPKQRAPATRVAPPPSPKASRSADEFSLTGEWVGTDHDGDKIGMLVEADGTVYLPVPNGRGMTFIGKVARDPAKPRRIELRDFSIRSPPDMPEKEIAPLQEELQKKGFSLAGEFEDGTRIRLEGVEGGDVRSDRKPWQLSRAPAEPSVVGRWFSDYPDGRIPSIIFNSDGTAVFPINAERIQLNATAKYKIDATAQPPRLDITDFNIEPPASMTESERDAFRRHLEQDEGAKEMRESVMFGEFESPWRIRLQDFKKSEATPRPALGAGAFTVSRIPFEKKATPSADYTAYLAAFQEGVARQNEGAYDAAVTAYTKAAEANPKDPAAYFNRGLCYSIKRQFNLAVADMTRALDADPKYIRAYHERARNRLNLEDWSPDLLEDCNKVLTAEPQNAELHVFRGAYYMKVGAKQAAEADFRKATSLDPSLAPRIQATKQALAAAKKKPPSRNKPKKQ